VCVGGGGACGIRAGYSGDRLGQGVEDRDVGRGGNRRAETTELAAGIEGDKRAALIIPDANFSQESIAGLRDGEIVAVGMLMTHRLSPLVVERAIPAARQLQIDLAEGEQRAKISVWLVGLTKVAGQPALLLYGNAPSPLIVTTLVESEKSKDGLLAIDVERSGDQRAAFFLKIAGTHRAAIHVTGQD
jgi:hypothetical protein